MGYKDILVFLGSAEEDGARLALAISLAQTHHARLVGVDGRSTSGSKESPLSDAADVEQVFQRELAQSGLDGVFRRADPHSPDWKTLFAHYVDLVIAPQAHEHMLPQIPEEILLSSGVPILVLPRLWQPRSVGESILIAWNGSREATRAIHDAMPLLVRAPKATLFVFGPRGGGKQADPDLMAEHLRNHGVSLDVLIWPEGEGMSAVTALIACIDQQQADLIVAGAHGHARLVESLFGSATDELLHQPSIPVLMSH